MPYVHIEITDEGVTEDAKAEVIAGVTASSTCSRQESGDDVRRHRRSPARQLGHRWRARCRVAVPGT